MWRADDPRRLVPRLPELRLHQRLQLMMQSVPADPVPARDNEQSIALSLAETVELLVHGRCTRREAAATDVSKVA